MARKEELINLLKEICGRIESESDCSKPITDLRKYIDKGVFFEYYSFDELLKILERNKKLSKSKTDEIFKLLNSLLRDGPNDKNNIVNRLHKFIDIKSRMDLLDDLITLCNFDKTIITTSPVKLSYISEKLLINSETIDQQKAIYKTYKNFFVEHGSSEEFILQLLQSLHRILITSWSVKKFNICAELMQEILLKAIVDKDFYIKTNNVYQELFKFFTFFETYGFCVEGAMNICHQLAEETIKLVTDKDLKDCTAIVSAVFKMCDQDTITETALNEFRTKHYMNSKTFGSNVQHQRTASLVAKLFTKNKNKFELTPECFSTFHCLSIAMFYVFKFIANEEGLVPCCADAKRHEVHNLIAIIVTFAYKLAIAENIKPTVLKNFIYHVNYDEGICGELKCESKGEELLKSFNNLITVLHLFISKPENKKLVPESINYLNEGIKILLKLWNNVPAELQAKTILNGSQIDAVAVAIYDLAKDKSAALTVANGIASIVNFRKHSTIEQSETEQNKRLIRHVFKLRDATKLLGFETVADFIKSKSFKDLGFAGKNAKVTVAEFIYLEMSAVFRFVPPSETKIIGKLFSDLCKETKDPQIIAQSLQLVTDATLQTMNLDEYKAAKKLLEETALKNPFDIDISLGLALSNHSLFYYMHEAIKKNIITDSIKSLSNLDLTKELELLKYLNSSLDHFTNAVCHLKKHKEDLYKLQSMKRVCTILLNIAFEYYHRGINHKDLETLTVLWNLSQLGEQSNSVLFDIGTFFLDNYETTIDATGNNINVSRKMKQLTVEDIQTKLNTMLDEQLIPSFETQPEQGNILSYILSLFTHNVVRGRRSEGFKRWYQFKKLWQVTTLQPGSVHHDSLKAKIYYSAVLINVSCCNKSADNFLILANKILTQIKTVDRDFMYQFYQIYSRITIKAINYSTNRLADLDHYDASMLQLLITTVKRGHCLKALQLLSMSITRHLNMEKIDKAKAQLKEITRLIGLNEEILIETPNKFEAPVTVFDYASQDVQVRKVVLKPESPIQVELSMIYEDHSVEMLQQIKAFVHESSCSCEICKVPQLKFIMFKIGCHYSRLLWLMEKFDISLQFNQFALQLWREVSDKLRRIKDGEFLMINKLDFAVFSIHWLFQCADTLIRSQNYQDVDEIYYEVELILTNNVPDYECLKQGLYCRKENIKFLLEHGNLEKDKESVAELPFSEFIKLREGKKDNKLRKSPLPVNVSIPPPTVPQSANKKKEEVIYIDSDDEVPATATVKITRKFTVPPAASVKASFTSRAKAEPKVASTSRAKAEPKAASTSRTKVMLNAESKAAPKAESKAAPKAESKAATKAKASAIDLTRDTPVGTRTTRGRKML